MKKLLGVCLFVMAGMVMGPSLTARADTITAMEVVVDDSVITSGEIQSDLAKVERSVYEKHANDQAGYEQEMVKLQNEDVEQRVENKLILREFVSSGYVTNVLEAFIDEDIDRYIKEQAYGDRARFIQTLHAQGRTLEMFRRERREQIILGFMNGQNLSDPHKILISPLKIETYYQAHKDEFKMDDQIKLRMIVLPKSTDSAPGATKELGEEILSKIDSGVPFAEMASVYSSGAQRAQGGEYGWVDRHYFKAPLTEVAFSLKAGQHSGVIVEPEACYVMQVEEVKPAHIKDVKEVRDDIERKLRNDENVRLRKLWIDRLRHKSYVKYY